MKRIVFIDGENFVYSLRTILAAAGEDKAPRSAINKLNIRGMLEELFADNPPTEYLWFGARLKVYDQTTELEAKSRSAIAIQSALVNFLQQQRIQFIKVGCLRARQSEPCASCGETAWKLAEKGVDVGLAVRILTEANNDSELVIISSDTDLVPAFKAAKKLEARLMYVAHEHRPIAALSQLSNTTRTITLPLVRKHETL